MRQPLQQPSDAWRSLLPPGHDAAGWHAVLVAEITRHLGAAHAAVLAAPQHTPAGLTWISEAAQVVPLDALAPSEQSALEAALRVVLSRLRRLAASGAAPAVAACWPALREIPDRAMIFAADGAPLLAGWGHVAAEVGEPPHLLDAYDDGLSAARPHWRLYRLGLGLVCLLAVLAGLLLPLSRMMDVSLANCVIDPADRGVRAREAQEAARHAALVSELAVLRQERGRRRLACAMPAQSDAGPPH